MKSKEYLTKLLVGSIHGYKWVENINKQTQQEVIKAYENSFKLNTEYDLRLSVISAKRLQKAYNNMCLALEKNNAKKAIGNVNYLDITFNIYLKSLIMHSLLSEGKEKQELEQSLSFFEQGDLKNFEQNDYPMFACSFLDMKINELESKKPIKVICVIKNGEEIENISMQKALNTAFYNCRTEYNLNLMTAKTIPTVFTTNDEAVERTHDVTYFNFKQATNEREV